MTETYDVKNCYECPGRYTFSGHGEGGTICGHLPNMQIIPNKGRRKDCPFNKDKVYIKIYHFV